MSNLPGQIDPLDPAAAAVSDVLAEEEANRRAQREEQQQPPDSHAEHRARRLRRLKLSVITSLMVRPLSFAVPLITVPLFLRYLGTERYGIYETITALAMWLGLTNFGLGLGLMNRLTEFDVKQDRASARLYTSTLFLAMVMLAGPMLIIFTAVVWFVPWASLLGAESDLARSEVTPGVWVAGSMTIVAVLATLPSAIYGGYQEMHRNTIWDGVSRLAMLLASVAVVLRPGFGSVGVLVASVGMPALVRLVNVVDLFAREKPWLRPSLRLFSWDALRSMAGEGVLLFLLAMSALLLFQMDKVIIAAGVGAADVAAYAILGRVFLIGYGLFMMVALPLWPASGEALRRGDVEWVRKTVRTMSIVGCGMMAAGGVALLVARRPMIAVLSWLAGSDEVSISASLVLAMTLTFVTRAWVDSRTVIFNSTGILVPQIPFYVGHAILNLIIAIIVVKPYGVEGVAWTTPITALLTSVWGYPWLLRRYVWSKPESFVAAKVQSSTNDHSQRDLQQRSS